jgi:hypothetical protein
VLRVIIHEPPAAVDRSDGATALDELEARLVARLRWRREHPDAANASGLSIGQLEEQLIAIHGRKSVNRSQRRKRV